MKYALLGIFFCLACNHALAQVNGVSINFNDFYGQTTDGTLGPLTGTSIAYSLNTSGANDISGVPITTPTASTVNLIQGQGSQATGWNQIVYDTPVNGTYSYQTTGSGVSSQSFSLTANGTFPVALTLGGTSIENLAAANGTAPVSLSLTYYSSSIKPSWLLYNLTTQTYSNGNISSANFTIPASSFATGQSYNLQLYSSYTSTLQRIPSTTINYTTTYQNVNVITFGAVATPEPSVFVLLLFAFAGGLVFSVVKKAQVRAA